MTALPEAECGAPASAFQMIPEDFDSSETPPGIPDGLSGWNLDDNNFTPVTEIDSDSYGLHFETVDYESKPRLLLIDRAGSHRIRVNDQKAARITLLNPGDQIRVDSGPASELALYHHVHIGKPGPAQIGMVCQGCLGAIEENSRIWLCPCGVVLHLEEDGDDPLECALAVHECAGCHSPIRLDSGYLEEPEFLK